MNVDKDLLISGMSYTNKDFASIYPEELDLITKLTNRWSPVTSNESDPGVVLTKENAFIADKLNYNVDKNILEAYFPSATQMNSIRKLSDMLGYNVKYYQAATVDISFKYNGKKLATGESIVLNAFDTYITDAENKLSFMLTQTITLTNNSDTFSASAIEGSLQTLTVNGNGIITLSNLDNNNRLYIPSSLVAENGIYIENDLGNSFWKKVDNLNVQSPGEFIYKFGYDSNRNLPFVEFPNDISSLIGSGLTVRYIETSGDSGNVKSGILTKLAKPSISSLTTTTGRNLLQINSIEESNQDSVLTISNISASINGRNPETIEEAYSNFKHIVGTFDTLVTCKDYANKIYSLQDSSSNYLVSNCQVADRRTDINYSNLIYTFSLNGITRVNNVSSFGTLVSITPYDLLIYPLKPLSNVYNETTYNNSFKPLDNNKLEEIKINLEDYKTISHNYKIIDDNDIYLYKNYYELDVRLSTITKVNSFEQAAIVDNVKLALYKKFYARNVEYGKEISYDSLLSTIQSADARIKNVILPEPKLTTKICFKNGNEIPLIEEDGSKNFNYIELAVKNILLGRIQLFEYNTDFNFEFGQTNISGKPSIINGLTHISSELTIPKDLLQNMYILRENEVVQAIAPKLNPSITYPAYVNYRFESGNKSIATIMQKATVNNSTYRPGVYYVQSGKNKAPGYLVDASGIEYSLAYGEFSSSETYYSLSKQGSSSKVLANSIYKLTGADKLYLNYTDSNKIEHTVVYTATTVQQDTLGVETVSENIIRPNFDLIPTDEQVSNITKQSPTKVINGLSFLTLDAKQSIEKMEFIQAVKDASTGTLFAYWKRNNPTNSLFTEADKVSDNTYEILLSDDEYFLWTNASQNELEVLTSGTVLKLNTPNFNSTLWKLNSANIISNDTINEKGLAAFSDYDYKIINFAEKEQLILEEQQILTLVENDGISIAGIQTNLTNDFAEVNNIITYKIGDETNTLDTFSFINWRVRTRLDISASPSSMQTLLSNQKVTFYTESSNTTLNGEGSFELSNLIQLSGSEYMDLGVTELSPSGVQEITYPINAFLFNYTQPTYIHTPINEDSSSYPVNIIRTDGYIQLDLQSLNENCILPICSTTDISKSQLLMIYFDSTNSSKTINLQFTGNIREFNTGANYSSGSITISTGIHTLELKNVTSITIPTLKSEKTGSYTLTLDRVKVISGNLEEYEGYNEDLDLSNNELNSLLNSLNIKQKDVTTGKNLFYYTIPSTSLNLIESDYSTPYALFDVDNFAHNFTIPQIDFSKSTFEISRNSREN